MKKLPFLRHSKAVFVFLATVLAFVAICRLGSNGPGTVEAKLNQATEALAQRTLAFPLSHPKVQAALAAQQRHTPQILSQPEVVGTATGVDDVEEPAVLVYTKRVVAPGILPDKVDGVPVKVKVAGEIFAMQVENFYSRPVPIGSSVGNRLECSAGTIGARVKDADGGVYALSNNHVLALENQGSIGNRIVQPGLYDTFCGFSRDYVIGALHDFEPISFSGDNIMDAALARCAGKNLTKDTPADGYGRPKTITAAPVINQEVQKYGRTTLLTRGTITAINGVFNVSYEAGVARFINQIVVQSTSAFILPGDSGSLLVTYPGKNPVGLLFAGNSSGTMAVANPIDPVLQRFGVTIDGYTPPEARSQVGPTSGNSGGISGGIAG